MMLTRKKHSKLKGFSPREYLMGSEAGFSFEHRIFNLTCVVTVLVLAAFLCINIIIGDSKASILVLGLLFIQLFFYFMSRKLRKYRSIILSYVIVVYGGLIANYYFNAGVDGPSLLLFFTTFQLALNISTKEKYLLWLCLSMTIPGILIATEFYAPRVIEGFYKSKRDKTIDLYGSYILALIYVYFATSSFKRHIITQQEREKKGAAEIEGYIIRLRAFFESLSDNFVLLDRDMKVLYFNKAAVELTTSHYGQKIEADLNISDFVHASNKESFHRCFYEALSGKEVTADFRRQYPTKETWWQTTFNPAYDENGQIIGVTMVMKDITNAYLYNLRIERKNKVLEKIAFIQAHELRGPLTSIQSLIELIKDEYGEMDLIYTRKLEEGLNRLDAKIKEIIMLSSEHTKELEL
jgi:PAS domain S-box-containing protein